MCNSKENVCNNSSQGVQNFPEEREEGDDREVPDWLQGKEDSQEEEEQIEETVNPLVDIVSKLGDLVDAGDRAMDDSTIYDQGKITKKSSGYQTVVSCMCVCLYCVCVCVCLCPHSFISVLPGLFFHSPGSCRLRYREYSGEFLKNIRINHLHLFEEVLRRVWRSFPKSEQRFLRKAGGAFFHNFLGPGSPRLPVVGRDEALEIMLESRILYPHQTAIHGQQSMSNNAHPSMHED